MRGDMRGSIAARLVMLVVLVAIAASIALYVDQRTDVADSPLGQASPTSDEPPLVVPGLEFGAPPPARSVLPTVSPAGPSTASAAALQRSLQRTLTSPALRSHVGFAVAELGSTELILGSRSDSVTPASTLKLLTTTAALQSLGPEHRFTTSVLRDVESGALVLVGGGDPLLTDERPSRSDKFFSSPEPAALEDLAARAARRLHSLGIREVSLTYDDSLFTGPAVSPAWEPDYVPESIVSPVSALWIDEGRVDTGEALRVGDPAGEAAKRFAELLVKQGIQVRETPRSGRASAQAEEIARVESAPLAEIVQHTIESSDNEAAEVLLRHVGIASGLPGSFVAGVKAMTTTLERLGVDLAEARIFDGSGLSRRSMVPVQALVAVLQVAADEDRPQLRSVVSSLPVAGFNGSLSSRFLAAAPAGLGVVRAKTGTLTGVHGLAGTVSTRGGSVLVFALVADRVPARLTLPARAQLERVTAALSSCTC